MTASTVTTIEAKTDAEFIEAIEQAHRTPVIVERNGSRYLINRLDDDQPTGGIWEGYDADRARQALHEATGLFHDVDVDVDRWIEEIYEARRLGSRPFDRP